LPLERTASMSELGTRKKNKTETKGRFSERNVPKSKSLCTLETNIDDVDETPQPGTLFEPRLTDGHGDDVILGG
jgi:hypothetical protein